MTVWKQAFVLGGAVLLLAACDRATGPSTQLQQRDPAAANLIFRPVGIPGTSTTNSATTPGTPGVDELCRSGYNVSAGRAEVSASCIEDMLQDQ
jgi:hypothetical protein